MLATLVLLTALQAQEQPSSEEGVQQQVLTLSEARQLAKRHNVDVQIARERLGQAAALAKQAWAVMLPVISANGQVVRNNTEIVVPFGLPPDLRPLFDSIGQPFPEPNNIVIQELYQSSAMASFNWVLLSGTSIPTVMNAYDSIEVAELSYEQAEKALDFATALTFFNVIFANAEVEVQQRALENARENLRLSRAQVEVGEATRVTALRSEVEVAAAKQGLIQARNAARIAHQALALLIGYVHPNGTITPFEVRREEEEPRLRLDEDLLELAYERRIDLKVNRLQLEIAERSRALTWLKFVPALVGTGLYRWSEAAGFSGENTSWQVGLALQWSLFEGGSRLWEAQARAHEVNMAALSIEKTREEIVTQVQNARLNLESARANLEVAQQRVELARESAELVTAQYEVGAATQLDVLDANRILADAETASALAQLAVDRTETSLQQVLLIPPSTGSGSAMQRQQSAGGSQSRAAGAGAGAAAGAAAAAAGGMGATGIGF